MSSATAAGPLPGPLYLVSMASYPNYGDELIARRWLRHLARTRPDDEVWLDCRHPGTASALFADDHPRLRVTDAIYRAMADSLHGSGREVEDIVANLGTPLYDAGLLRLREAGALHLLGGGFVNAVWTENALVVRAMREAARISGARLIATGQGLMPAGPEQLQGFHHVSVRDAPSAELLGIEPGVDDAFLLDAVPAVTIGNHQVELVVCVQSDAQDEGVFDWFVDWTRGMIRASRIPRERVRYVEALPGADYAGYDRLRDVVAEDGFVPFTSFWRGEFAPGPHQVWSTTRFHHHLVAAMHGARGIALSGRSGYYDVKHGSLVELGSNWHVTDGSDMAFPALATLQRPRGFAERAVRAKRAEANALYSAT
ncbi:MAG: polysaccharide pyruvyl transferase family protein [Brachybacterium faecium]|nr:MAG: polysaccharide pyruvyl transferase family protein [Brachybacterium faecium]